MSKIDERVEAVARALVHELYVSWEKAYRAAPKVLVALKDSAPASAPSIDGEINAAQITMGRGMVDVAPIHHEGRAGVLFRPRAEHIPVGEPGELQDTKYWPIAGDVVIWIDNDAGAEVARGAFAEFCAPASAPSCCGAEKIVMEAAVREGCTIAHASRIARRVSSDDFTDAEYTEAIERIYDHSLEVAAKLRSENEAMRAEIAARAALAMQEPASEPAPFASREQRIAMEQRGYELASEPAPASAVMICPHKDIECRSIICSPTIGCQIDRGTRQEPAPASAPSCSHPDCGCLVNFLGGFQPKFPDDCPRLAEQEPASEPAKGACPVCGCEEVDHRDLWTCRCPASEREPAPAPSCCGAWKALEEIADLGSDGTHSGDRHARCRKIAWEALAARAQPCQCGERADESNMTELSQEIDRLQTKLNALAATAPRSGES